MNELIAPISLLGLLCTSQSVNNPSILASLEFSFSVLLVSCAISLLFIKKSPKRNQVFALKTLIRGFFVNLSTVFWGWSIVRLGAAKCILVEIICLLLLSSLPDIQSKKQQKDFVLISLCFISLVGLGQSHYGSSTTIDGRTSFLSTWFAICACAISICIREMFHLFKDISSVGMGGFMSLLATMAAYIFFPSLSAVAVVINGSPGNNFPSLQWVFASALLWIVPASLSPIPSDAERWYEYSQTKKSRLVFGLSCVALFALTQRDLHNLGFFVGFACTIAATLRKKTKLERTSFLPTTINNGVDNSDGKEGDYSKKLPSNVMSLMGILVMVQRYVNVPHVIHFFREAMLDKDSKKILQFLTLTLSFMFVEIVVGLYTGSLGLISDAGHMFFDSAALFIGLFAAFASRWRPDNVYTFGYGRYETIAGFVNAVFLTFVAVFVLTESLERFSEPPEIRTDGLLLTSVLGLVVNGIGLVFFHEHAHSHAGDGSHSHSHSHSSNSNGSDSTHTKKGVNKSRHAHSNDHSHSHGAASHSHDHHAHSHESKHDHSHGSHGHSHASHGHSHDENGHAHEAGCSHDHHDDEESKTSEIHGHNDIHVENENMHGVYLHVLADALGSVGVIISSLLIQYKGWYIADPICSFCISVLIFLSVVPLVKSTASSLMLRVPSDFERKFDSLIARCKRRPGVVRVHRAHLWRHSKDIVVATTNIIVSSKDQQDPIMAWMIQALKTEVGATDVTVQICTEAASRELIT
jgi:zinc transporter 5/7